MKLQARRSQIDADFWTATGWKNPIAILFFSVEIGVLAAYVVYVLANS
jgi:hypothetical protein